MSAGLASPGRYRLRVAAIDTAGRRGSADYDLAAEAVTVNGTTLSTMVLGVSFGRTFVPKLQFAAEPTANGKFEIFDPPPTGTLSVAMELAATEDGPALVRVPGTIAATGDATRRRATGVAGADRDLMAGLRPTQRQAVAEGAGAAENRDGVGHAAS